MSGVKRAVIVALPVVSTVCAICLGAACVHSSMGSIDIQSALAPPGCQFSRQHTNTHQLSRRRKKLSYLWVEMVVGGGWMQREERKKKEKA